MPCVGCQHGALHGRHTRLVCEARLFGAPKKQPSPPAPSATARKSPATTTAPPLSLTAPKGQDESSKGGGTPFPPSPVQQVSEFASQLVTSFSWPSLYPQSEPTQASTSQASQSQPQSRASASPDITPCLATSVGVWELKHIRKLAHLTALTYKMHTVTPRALRRKHGLELVTTSWACEIRLYEHNKSAEEVVEEGDGMAVSVLDARTTYNGLAGRAPASNQAAGQSAPGTTALGSPNVSTNSLTSNTPTTQPAANAPAHQQPVQQQQQQQQQPKRWSSPAEMVAGMLSDAASAAASAVPVAPIAEAAGSLYASAAGSLYAGLASLPIASALGAGPRSSAPAAAAALMSAAAAAVSSSSNSHNSQPDTAGSTQHNITARLAAAAGPAAIAAAPAHGARLAAPVQSTTGSPACPSEWFVCDDVATDTRYFVIQGSDTIDHWKLNLTFDPVTFEDPHLGIKVHRGAYEAAEILYERFLPMVYEHLDSSPFAKICFTGHSIGGSLSTLLAMMYHYRGVLPTSSLANVYTFGAPAIFCMDPDAPEALAERFRQHGHTHSHHWHHHKPQAASQSDAVVAAASPKPAKSSSPGTAVTTAAPSSASAPVRACSCGHSSVTPLTAVGLADHMVRNVIMAKDIVPRAFACDYSLVADILKGWGPSFKSHSGLAHPKHKHLFFFTGRIMVLQPDNWHWFVNAEPGHPLLPSGPNLYLVSSAAATQPAKRPTRVSSPPVPSVPNGKVPEGGSKATTTATNGTVPQTAAPATPATATSSKSAVGSNSSGNGSKPGRTAAVPLVANNITEYTPANGKPSSAQLVVSSSGGGASRTPVYSAQDALWALMDTPHPLDTLADPGAYLEKGSISRYHNPDNYTAALGRLIYLKRKEEGRIPKWVNHSYSRSLSMEAAEEQGVGVGAAGGWELAPWDSSDGDTTLSTPFLTPLEEVLQEEVAALRHEPHPADA